jgi:hypothetical protein
LRTVLWVKCNYRPAPPSYDLFSSQPVKVLYDTCCNLYISIHWSRGGWLQQTNVNTLCKNKLHSTCKWQYLLTHKFLSFQFLFQLRYVNAGKRRIWDKKLWNLYFHISILRLILYPTENTWLTQSNDFCRDILIILIDCK